jgi:hypothetical protein
MLGETHCPDINGCDPAERKINCLELLVFHYEPPRINYF